MHEIWLKHSECSKADRYGKDLEGRNSNTEYLQRSKEKQKGTKKEEKRIKMAQMIQNMVLGSMKFESVSLFTIILSVIKL
jgi:dsDNA-binding SOS-regulon protein